MTRTMGVDQVYGDLDVAVIEWGDAGVETSLFSGRIHVEGCTTMLRQMVESYSVQRALIDPEPDERLARMLIRQMPDVFSIEVPDGLHDARSLAVIARKRIVAAERARGVPDPDRADHAHITAATTPGDDGDNLAYRMHLGIYVPPGEPMPQSVHIDLTGAEPMERMGGADGARMLHHTVGPEHMTLSARLPGEQRWTLAPTTTLPTKGWTHVLSLYDGGSRLIHEQALTLGQVLGLANLVPISCQQASVWLNANHKPPLPTGPYYAVFEIFAAQESVHQVTMDSVADLSEFAGSLRPVADEVSSWIHENAVALAEQYPGANIPAPGPYDLPDVTQDTYDYPPTA